MAFSIRLMTMTTIAAADRFHTAAVFQRD